MRFPLAISLLFSAFYFLFASQITIIENETNKVVEKLSAQGFTCRTQVAAGNADKFEIKMAMNKNILYYFAIVTGKGETVVHPSGITLINQNKKIIPLIGQNKEFGTEIALHPLTDGEKVLKFRMQRKTQYSVLLCESEASLYHTGQKSPVFDDHTHF